MSTIPPDWDNEQKLWKALETPTPKTSVHFNAAVRKRIHQLARQKQRASFWRSFGSFFDIFRSWSVGVSLATACIVVGLVIYVKAPLRHMVQVSQEVKVESSTVELASIAQNLEIIEDLDVIEHLDELASN